MCDRRIGADDKRQCRYKRSGIDESAAIRIQIRIQIDDRKSAGCDFTAAFSLLQGYKSHTR